MTHHPRAGAKPGSRRRRGLGLALVAVAVAGLGGCATVGGNAGQPLVPARADRRVGPFQVYSNQPIPPDSSALRSLQALERDLSTQLRLRVGEDVPPVEVYILKDRDAFAHFLTFYHPELPPRRAFFLAQGPQRVVYTFYNDRLDEDLRHEATHALLHATVGDLPLWLDEGLAEYFEGPEGRQGLNPEHLARLPDDLKAGWRPDLARLETLTNVREMTPRDYRESWAWVHYLLNEPGPGRPALLSYLHELKAQPVSPPLLAERLAKTDLADGQRVLSHLEKLRTNPAPAAAPAPVAASTPEAGATVLLQDSALEPPPHGSQRRSLLGRALGFLGFGGKP